MGMLENPMDNDLNLVDKAIREYYELKPVGLVERKQNKNLAETADKIPG